MKLPFRLNLFFFISKICQKSQNVLIGENYKVKLCDLGLATILENQKRMTVCGTDVCDVTFCSFEFRKN